MLKNTALIIVLGVLLLCMLFLFIFEKRKTDSKKLILIAVMTAMSVLGRLIFAAFPGFKPVTAIVIITGMYLGCEAGFYCGALTALITNFYFGQGAYTPFQMLVWGLIGIAAGLMSGILRKNKFLLYSFGAVSGIAFSLLMDIYTVIWSFGHFDWKTYLVMIGSALPYTIIYAVSNVIFLMVLSNPVGKKIERAGTKYLV